MQKKIREMGQKINPELRWSSDTLECLHQAGEAYITRYFEDANSAALHAGRVTLNKKDMDYIRNMRMRHGIYPGSYTALDDRRLCQPPLTE